jgi:hypothetical protein
VPNVTVVLSKVKEFVLLTALQFYKINWEKGGKNEEVASILQEVYDISCLIQCISCILMFICKWYSPKSLR